MKTLVMGSVPPVCRIKFFFWTMWKKIKVQKSYGDNTHFILKIELNELFLLSKATTYRTRMISVVLFS